MNGVQDVRECVIVCSYPHRCDCRLVVYDNLFCLQDCPKNPFIHQILHSRGNHLFILHLPFRPRLLFILAIVAIVKDFQAWIKQSEAMLKGCRGAGNLRLLR